MACLLKYVIPGPNIIGSNSKASVYMDSKEPSRDFLPNQSRPALEGLEAGFESPHPKDKEGWVSKLKVRIQAL